MKKVFISVPMKGRTKENIEMSIAKMKAITSEYFKGEELEFVNTLVEETPPYLLDERRNAIWYLGKSIELLSQCDLLVTLDDAFWFRGCANEKRIAVDYGLKVLELSFYYICPDVIKQERDKMECERAR